MRKIFLSYTRSDLPKFESLLRVLEENELYIWKDVECIRGGEKWPKAIGEAIASHDIVLLIWSRDSSKSYFVELEWNTAIALRKTIIPLLLDDTNLPAILNSINAIRFNEITEPFSDVLKALQITPEETPLDLQNNVIKTLNEIDGKQEKAATEEAIQKYLNKNWVELIQDIFSIFQNSPSPLIDYIRIKDFETIVKDKTKDFIGRDFIFDKIDEIINSPDFTSGYVVIKGEPGIGKTALLSQLVKQRGYVHHFNSYTDNIRSSHIFLSNICAQLIVKYGLNYDRLPDKATEDSGFMRQLLAEAVGKTENKKVIVVIDALDEANDDNFQDGVNKLYLPSILPESAYIIITMRENNDEHLDVERKEYVPLNDEDPKNIEDIKKYIINYLNNYRNQMGMRLKEWAIDKTDFIDKLVKKSEGNFQYINYVLPSIKNGKLNSIDIKNIEDLPTGLQGYYRRHWRFMKSADAERYKRLQKPVLCFLATAIEPISMNILLEWMKQVYLSNPPDSSDILNIIREWREFLNQRKSDNGEYLYHIYHRSFCDFLDEEEGLTEYHRMIAINVRDKIHAFKKQSENIKK
jgi:hypothetical protein